MEAQKGGGHGMWALSRVECDLVGGSGTYRWFGFRMEKDLLFLIF